MSIFMKIDGIKGDVTAEGYQGWIEIDGFKLESRRNISVKPGRIQNREGETPRFEDMIITKPIDKSTPHLFMQSCVGKAMPSVEIHVCKTGDRPKPLQKILISKAMINHYEREVHKTGKPVETITLNFTKIEDTYIPYDSSQNAGSPIKSGYDLETVSKV